MSTSQLASRVGAVALCVGLSAAPWLRVLGDCPAPATGTCGSEAYSSDCPCAPKDGYKACEDLTTKAACQGNGGHDVKAALWECKSGSQNHQCINGSNTLCWRKLACVWLTQTNPPSCMTDFNQVLDEAKYVAKTTAPCGSGSK